MKSRQGIFMYSAFFILIVGLLSACSSSCSVSTMSYGDGSIKIEVKPGSEWIHHFPLLGPITKPNRPTFALWISDEQGQFLDTIYVTRKAAQGTWLYADDDRPEALPLWSYMKGRPVPDALSGATPKGTSSYLLDIKALPERFIVWLEINHSVDYNDSYPEGIDDPKDNRYSGAKGGSGQPALVYRALVEPAIQRGSTVEFSLIGHSEAGSIGEGKVYDDLSGFTTALRIIEKALVHVY